MGASLELRKFRPDGLERAVEAIAEQEAAGTSVQLGQQWEELHAALVGSDRDLSTIPSQVVLGGTILERSEEDSTMVLALRPQEVSAVADYLSGVDAAGIRRLVESHGEEIEQVLGEIDDWQAVRTFVSRCLDELRDFYAGAAEDGAAVVKLVS